MKKTSRTLAGVSTATLIGTNVAMHAAPASAWAVIDAAATPLFAMPAAEILILGMIGLCCLGVARHRAAT